MADTESPPSAVKPIDKGGMVGLVEYEGDPEEEEFHEGVTVNVDSLIEFADEAKVMGLDHVRLYVHDNSVVLAREQGDESGMFVGLAPMIVDGNEVPDE